MTLLTLAGAGHLSRLLPMVAACHSEAGQGSSDSRRRQALEPVLRGTPLGAIWIIGEKIAPQGYVSVGFSWSITRGGPLAQIDEFWLRPEARGAGTGSRALAELLPELQKRGALALQVQLTENSRLAAFYARQSFFAAGGSRLAQRRL